MTSTYQKKIFNMIPSTYTPMNNLKYSLNPELINEYFNIIEQQDYSGAELYKLTNKISIYASNNDGDTILHFLIKTVNIKYSEIELIEMFKKIPNIEKLINIKNNLKQTPMHLICMNQLKKIYFYFINQDIKINFNSIDEYNRTPYHYACIGKKIKYSIIDSFKEFIKNIKQLYAIPDFEETASIDKIITNFNNIINKYSVTQNKTVFEIKNIGEVDIIYEYQNNDDSEVYFYDIFDIDNDNNEDIIIQSNELKKVDIKIFLKNIYRNCTNLKYYYIETDIKNDIKKRIFNINQLDFYNKKAYDYDLMNLLDYFDYDDDLNKVIFKSENTTDREKKIKKWILSTYKKENHIKLNEDTLNIIDYVNYNSLMIPIIDYKFYEKIVNKNIVNEKQKLIIDIFKKKIDEPLANITANMSGGSIYKNIQLEKMYELLINEMLLKSLNIILNNKHEVNKINKIKYFIALTILKNITNENDNKNKKKLMFDEIYNILTDACDSIDDLIKYIQKIYWDRINIF